jgi:hypothetical protein
MKVCEYGSKNQFLRSNHQEYKAGFYTLVLGKLDLVKPGII